MVDETIKMKGLKFLIEKYLPEIPIFFRDYPLDYLELEECYLKNIWRRKELAKSGTKQVSATIYDICQMAQAEEAAAKRILVYFNNLCWELGKYIQPEKIILVHKTFMNFLSEPDYNYLNFLGEISILNQILKSRVFVLEDVEYPLGNGFHADFRFYHLKDKKHSLLEVVSLHINPGAVLDEKSFVKYFKGKVLKKLQKKKRSDKHGFVLAPVIWAEGAELRKIYDLYKNGMEILMPGVLVPSAYINYYNQEGKSNPVFGSIDTLFDEAFVNSIRLKL